MRKFISERILMSCDGVGLSVELISNLSNYLEFLFGHALFCIRPLLELDLHSADPARSSALVQPAEVS